MPIIQLSIYFQLFKFEKRKNPRVCGHLQPKNSACFAEFRQKFFSFSSKSILKPLNEANVRFFCVQPRDFSKINAQNEFDEMRKHTPKKNNSE